MAATVTIQLTLNTSDASRKLREFQTDFKATMTGILDDAREASVGMEGLFNALRFDARGITGPADAAVKSLDVLSDQAKVTRATIGELSGAGFNSSKTVSEAEKATAALEKMKSAGGSFAPPTSGGGSGSSRPPSNHGSGGGESGSGHGGGEERAGIADVFGAYADLSVIVEGLRGVGDVVKTGAEIQKNVTALYATAGETMPQQQFTQRLESQANTNNILPSDASKSIYPIESAGMHGNDALTVLGNSEKLAVGTQGELADAVDLVTKSLIVYQKGAKDSSTDTDIFTRAITDSLETGKQFTPALANVLDTGRHAGLSLAELSSALAVLTAQTKSAATGSTYLKAFLSALIDPTDKTKKAAKEAGLGWLATGRGMEEIKKVGFVGVLEQINAATNGNAEAMAALFPDLRKNQAAFGLLNDGGVKYIQTLKDVSNSTGSTDAAAAKMDSTLSQLGVGFESRLETLDTNLTSDLGPAFVTAGGAVETLIDALNNMDPATRRIVEGTLLVGAAIIGSAAAIRLVATTWRALYGPEVAGGIVKLIGAFKATGAAAAQAGVAGAEAQASIGGAADKSAGQVQTADAKIIEANEAVTTSAKEAAVAQAGIGDAAEGAAAKTEAAAATEATAAEGAETAVEGAGAAQGAFIAEGASGLALSGGAWGVAAVAAVGVILAIADAWQQAKEKQDQFYANEHTGDPSHDLNAQLASVNGQINQITNATGGRDGNNIRAEKLVPLEQQKQQLETLINAGKTGDTGYFHQNIDRWTATRNQLESQIKDLQAKASTVNTAGNHGNNPYSGQLADLNNQLAAANQHIKDYQEYSKTAETNRATSGGPEATDVVGSAIANASAQEIRQFSGHCQAWVRTAISKVPAANAELSKYFRGTAKETMEAFQAAGVGHPYKPGEAVPAGALIYSGRMGRDRKTGQIDGHAAIEGNSGQVLGTAGMPSNKIDWVVVPGSSKGGGTGLPFTSGARPAWLGKGDKDGNDAAALDAASAAVDKAEGSVAAAQAALDLCQSEYTRTGNPAFLMHARRAAAALRNAQIDQAQQKLAKSNTEAHKAGTTGQGGKAEYANSLASINRDYTKTDLGIQDQITGTPADQQKSARNIVIAGLQRQIAIKDNVASSYSRLLDQGTVSDAQPLTATITSRYGLQKQLLNQQYEQQRADNPADTKELNAQEQTEQSKLYLDYQKQIQAVEVERREAEVKQYTDARAMLDLQRQSLTTDLAQSHSDADRVALRKKLFENTQSQLLAQLNADRLSQDPAVRDHAGDRYTLGVQGALGDMNAGNAQDSRQASANRISLLRAEAEATRDLAEKKRLLQEATGYEGMAANATGDPNVIKAWQESSQRELDAVDHEQAKRNADQQYSSVLMNPHATPQQGQDALKGYLDLATDTTQSINDQQGAISNYLDVLDSLFKAHVISRAQALADIKQLETETGAALTPEMLKQIQQSQSEISKTGKYEPQAIGGDQYWSSMRDGVGDAVGKGLDDAFKGSHKAMDDFGKSLEETAEKSLENAASKGMDNLIGGGANWLMGLFKGSGNGQPGAGSPASSGGGFMGLPMSMWSKIPGVSSAVPSAASTAASTAATATQAVTQTASSTAASTAASAGTSAGISAMSAAVPWLAGAAVLSNPAAVKAIGDSIAKITEATGKVIEDVGKAAEDALAGVGKMYAGMGEGIGKAAVGIGQGAGDLMSGAGKGIHSVISAFTGADAPRITTQTVQSMHNDMVIVGASPLSMLSGKAGGAGGLLGALGGLLHLSEGGWVPGNGNRDTVPAMLTPGEFVISKRMMTGGSSSDLGRRLKAPVTGFNHPLGQASPAPAAHMSSQAVGYLRAIAGKLDRPHQTEIHNYPSPSQPRPTQGNYQRSVATAR